MLNSPARVTDTPHWKFRTSLSTLRSDPRTCVGAERRRLDQCRTCSERADILCSSVESSRSIKTIATANNHDTGVSTSFDIIVEGLLFRSSIILRVVIPGLGSGRITHFRGHGNRCRSCASRGVSTRQSLHLRNRCPARVEAQGREGRDPYGPFW